MKDIVSNVFMSFGVPHSGRGVTKALIRGGGRIFIFSCSIR